MTDPLPRHIAWFAPWTWKRRWWIVAAVLLIGYPLSIGPALVLVRHGWIPLAVYSAMIYPIQCLERFVNNKEFSTLLFWYLNLFMPK